MSEPSAIERVMQSPDEDCANGMATYCVGCGSCAYLDPAFRIVRNMDGCYQAAVQGKVRDSGSAAEACPFASGVNEDDIGAGLFSERLCRLCRGGWMAGARQLRRHGQLARRQDA